MRASPSIVRAISRGAATTLHVPYMDRYSHRVAKGRTVVTKPFRPQAGDRLPVHGGEHRMVEGREKWVNVVTLYVDVGAVARVDGRLPALGHLTDLEAISAGYETPAVFEVAWVRQHDRPWFQRQYQQLLEAGVEPGDALETCGYFARTRYTDLWSTRPAWVLTIRPAHDMPMLLADEHGTPKTPASLPDGYVHALSEALTEEPEAVDTAVLDPRWREHAVRRHEKARASASLVEPWVAKPARGELSLGERLDLALEAKRLAGRSTTSETRLVEGRIAAIEQDLRGTEAA